MNLLSCFSFLLFQFHFVSIILFSVHSLFSFAFNSKANGKKKYERENWIWARVNSRILAHQTSNAYFGWGVWAVVEWTRYWVDYIIWLVLFVFGAVEWAPGSFAHSTGAPLCVYLFCYVFCFYVLCFFCVTNLSSSGIELYSPRCGPTVIFFISFCSRELFDAIFACLKTKSNFVQPNQLTQCALAPPTSSVRLNAIFVGKKKKHRVRDPQHTHTHITYFDMPGVWWRTIFLFIYSFVYVRFL